MTRTRVVVMWSVIGAAALGLVSACSGPTEGSGAETSESLQTLADKLATGQEQLKTTMASLDAITSGGEGSLVDRFDAYTTNVKTLEKTADSVRTTAEAVRRKGEQYIEKWNAEVAEIQNEDIKKRSVERQAEVREALEKVRANIDELSEAFRPLMTDLKDMQAALKADLTASGVEVIEKPAKEAQTKAQKVLKESDEVIADFRKLGGRLSSEGEAAPPQ